MLIRLKWGQGTHCAYRFHRMDEILRGTAKASGLGMVLIWMKNATLTPIRSIWRPMKTQPKESMLYQPHKFSYLVTRMRLWLLCKYKFP